ncbi:MAG: hypothetical protein EA397_03655 [Deltaproteobacteria bacterium]|nr:MAG: hypothetical protein EA397_03655 [Deltaproteobacteria bacterium]
MNDIDLIRDLGQLDDKLDSLSRAHARESAREPEARQALAHATAEASETAKALAGLREAERSASREVTLYQKRRAAATRALEQGLGDPEAAQRQVEQCAQIIDEFETRQLELLEAIETAQQTLAERQRVQSEAEQALGQHIVEAGEALAAIEAQRGRLQPQRDRAHEALPKDLGLRYDLVRSKKGSAVAALQDDDSCSTCRLRAPMAEASEIRRGLLKSCRGCGRYLLPPA